VTVGGGGRGPGLPSPVVGFEACVRLEAEAR